MATLIKKLSMTSGPGFEIWTRVIEDGDVTTELLIASDHKDVERMNGAGVSQSFKAQKRFIKKVPKRFSVRWRLRERNEFQIIFQSEQQ